MNTTSVIPNEETALFVVEQMRNEKVASVSRMRTGEQYFVFVVKTKAAEYVIRMTVGTRKTYLQSAIYWQEKLLPLGIPLAEFIDTDLDGKYSPFPAVLMKRLPGDDLCNVYSSLSNKDKKHLAHQIVEIQKKTKKLPDGIGFGYTAAYEKHPGHENWYNFLIANLNFYIESIADHKIFNMDKINEVIPLFAKRKNTFNRVTSRPFLYDASERNVIVHEGGITGIVDVDDICFGDPLFVIGLTYTALLLDGHDTLYCDYWVEISTLGEEAHVKLAHYRLFYAILFMHKCNMTTENNTKIGYSTEKLKTIFNEALEVVKKLI